MKRHRCKNIFEKCFFDYMWQHFLYLHHLGLRKSPAQPIWTKLKWGTKIWIIIPLTSGRRARLCAALTSSKVRRRKLFVAQHLNFVLYFCVCFYDSSQRMTMRRRKVTIQVLRREMGRRLSLQVGPSRALSSLPAPSRAAPHSIKLRPLPLRCLSKRETRRCCTLSLKSILISFLQIKETINTD